MRRSLLLTVTALGALICLMGGTGLFAALTDTARTGTNSIDSAPLAGTADIQLAPGDWLVGATGTTGRLVECGEYSENLATGFFSASGVQPNYASDEVPYCIRNVGSAAVNLSAFADELTDVDDSCTGDEALHGDTTCGGGALGELSSVLRIRYAVLHDCSDAGSIDSRTVGLSDNATVGEPILGTLQPGAFGCFSVQVIYGGATTDAIQVAQSDTSTWRFKFVAQS